MDRKKVAEILWHFGELGLEGTPEEPLFLRMRSLYETCNEQEKEAFFAGLVADFEVKEDALRPLIREIDACKAGDPGWPGLVSRLRTLLHSPRLDVLRKISRTPGGLKFLLDLRGDLLSLQRSSKWDLRPLDLDITLLFDLWFQDGFLYLEEITQDSSYRQIELIKNSDLVHPMTRIEEMGQRLGKDRRCFALYHRLMPYEPIVFIEVALTRGIVGKIALIIDGEVHRTETPHPDTAVFYSINNTQHGLAGLGLGKMLIFQVVDSLKKENQEIRNFVTLSPVPGFWKEYLKQILEGNDRPFALKQKEIVSFFSKREAAQIVASASPAKKGGFNEALLRVLSDEQWVDREELTKALHDPLVKIAYHYISNEKNPQNKPLNPVAGFHLGNGAAVSRRNVNFLGNPSSKGVSESCGIMVNYIYSSDWMTQILRSFRWFERLEIKGMFSRGK